MPTFVQKGVGLLKSLGLTCRAWNLDLLKRCTLYNVFFSFQKRNIIYTKVQKKQCTFWIFKIAGWQLNRSSPHVQHLSMLIQEFPTFYYTKPSIYSTRHRTLWWCYDPLKEWGRLLDCFLLFPQKHDSYWLTIGRQKEHYIRLATVWHLLVKCFTICRNSQYKTLCLYFLFK